MKKIFIVDDNEMMRAFLLNFFKKNYEVRAFASGEEALATIDTESKPDLLLLDFELEGMSGYDTMKSLKASELFKNVPVMFLSGKQKSEIRIDCLKAGAADFISKPFNPVELSLKIEKQLSSVK
jgi:DNA-binding response OmpR family regulator